MSGRIRTIKPELLEDAVTAGLSDSAFRVFIAMILLADDYGNLRAEHKYLDGQIYWSSVPEKSVRLSCEELETLVSFYMVRGQLYGHINGWEKHQKVQHLGKPRVPGLAEKDSDFFHASLVKVSGDSRESLSPDLRPHTSDLIPPNVAIASAPESPPEDRLDEVEIVDDAKPEKRSDEIRAVWEHFVARWTITIGTGRPPSLSPERRRMIRARLNGGRSVDDLRLACDGLWGSDWNIENGQTHPELVFRNDGQVEKYIAKAPKPQSNDQPAPPKAIKPWLLDDVAGAETA